ncbi:CHASE domain-containing protein [Sphingomonas sp. ST-64]|uniref:histidine kinase n=1 Tax=Sphingomonas plantiphila TaxID=3163295 RepID=A0ABW8YN09_9SPHN
MTDAPSWSIAAGVDAAPEPTAFVAPERGLRYRAQAVLLLAICFTLSGLVARQLAIPPARVTMLWFPSGVAVGALLLYGRWLWPGVWAGSYALNIVLGVSMGSKPEAAATLALFTATGATLQALAAEWLLRRRFGARIDVSRPSAVVAAIVLGAVIPALCSSGIGHIGLVLLRDFPADRLPSSVAIWALGDALGIAMVAPFAMIGKRRRLRAYWRDHAVRGLYGFLALGFGLGLALTLFAWSIARERIHERNESAFAALTVESEQALRGQLNAAARSLDGAAALFSAGERVTWPEWITFANVVDVEDSLPGIRDIGFIRAVPEDGLAAFRAEAARDGLPIDQILQQRATGPHYVVKYIYPLQTNGRVLGMDITFDARRREAADRARVSGTAIVSRPIAFVQYRGPGASFIMLRPVHRGPIAPRTAAERQRSFIGWVYHPFTAPDFFGRLTPRQGKEFDLGISVDRADGGEDLVYHSTGSTDEPVPPTQFTASRQFESQGRRWTIHWHSTPAFEERVASSEPLLVLLTGLTINIALAAVLAIIARRESIVTREVERATAKLSETNRMLMLTEARAHVGHWRYDEKTDALFWSDEVYRIHGLKPGTPVDRHLAHRAYHPDDRDQVRRIILNAIAEGTEFRYRARIVRPDGAVRYLSSLGRAEGGQDGSPVTVFGVLQDVTSETKVREQLLVARDAAQEAARARGAFLANLSHEIRTPMNGVIGFAELLLQTPLDPEQRSHAQIIADSSASMMSLLNDVLDLSKIEAGHMALASEAIDMSELANSAMRMLLPSLRQREVFLELQIDPALPDRVIGDKLRLRQVLLNLLGNAAKFTERGFIRLEVRRQGARMRFAVADSGVGIPRERLEDIFGSFVQLDPTARTAGIGTGLGLAISDSLVRLMGGRLQVNSKPGEGSTFFFTLPCVAAPEAATGSDGDDPLAAPLTVPAARVLLAEDNDINQALIRATAQQLGLNLDTVENGAEAVARVEQAEREGAPYDLVLMDIQMPVMNGLVATEQLRAKGHSPERLPIIALTANVYQDDVDACIAAGMQAHLPKPLRREALERAIATWARRSGPVRGTADTVPEAAAAIPTSLVERYTGRRAALVDLLRAFDIGVAKETQRVARLVSEIHKLAGTAAYFGDDAAGAAAREIEPALLDASPEERVALVRAFLTILETGSQRTGS